MNVPMFWIFCAVLMVTFLNVESRKRDEEGTDIENKQSRRKDKTNDKEKTKKRERASLLEALSINPDLQRSTAPKGKTVILDPRVSWNYFQRSNDHNERRDEAHKLKKKAFRERKQQLRSGTVFSRGTIGPPGPKGPPGPRGPAGANITKDEMLEEFRAMIRELAARKLLTAGNPRCTEMCVSNLDGNETGPIVQDSIFEDSHDLLVPKVAYSFMWELKHYYTVLRKTLVELEPYVPVARPGGLERHIGISKPESGRFVIPRRGFYNFFVRMHMQLPDKGDSNSNGDDKLLSVLLCIESLCRENTHLESISGFGSADKMTNSINGVLYLEEGQYVSVFIDNNSHHNVHVFEGSQFSGYLIGV